MLQHETDFSFHLGMADRWCGLSRPAGCPCALWRAAPSSALGAQQTTRNAHQPDTWSSKHHARLTSPCEPVPIFPQVSLAAGAPGISKLTIHSGMVPSVTVSAQWPPLSADTCAPSLCPRPPQGPQPACSAAAMLRISHKEHPLSPAPTGVPVPASSPSCSPSVAGPYRMATCSLPGAPQGSCPTVPVG